MWELYYKESWAPKNWCSWTVVLEKTLESPLDCKEIQPVHPKGDQSWIFTGCWTLANWHEELTHLKRPWCWERLRAGGEGDNRGWDGWMASPTQCTWVGWTLGVGDGQGGLACCGSWGHKESDTTEWLTWTEWDVNSKTGLWKILVSALHSTWLLQLAHYVVSRPMEKPTWQSTERSLQPPPASLSPPAHGELNPTNNHSKNLELLPSHTLRWRQPLPCRDSGCVRNPESDEPIRPHPHCWPTGTMR